MNFNMSENEFKSVIPISLATITFSLYWFLSVSDKIKKWFYAQSTFDLASIKHFVFNKTMGFLIMGLIPFLICFFAFPKYHLVGLNMFYKDDSLLFNVFWIFCLLCIALPMVFLSGKKSKNLLNYPQIRAKVWTRKTLLIYLGGWAIYIFGYELLFRGLLFLPLITAIGLGPAIAINVALYSISHIPKGHDETIATIPLGIVLCILTSLSVTIWIAFFVHVCISWTNSLAALRAHPDIQYKYLTKHELPK